MIPLRINLEPEEIPTHWYNVAADLTNPPAPPLAPDGSVVTPEQMNAIFPMPILEQEMSAERWIVIPEEVRLESHDLGHRARAEDTQSVATYLHPLFLDWPLAQATEDSWAACEQYVWVSLGVALFDARCAKSGKPTHTSASVGAERRADRQPAGRRRNYFN